MLRTRWFVRMPIAIYRSGLGPIFGRRLLMLQHTGRASGQRRYVVLETVLRPQPDQIVIASGFGTHAQWYRNLQADPHVTVSTGRIRSRAASAELLSEAESAAVLGDYSQHHGAQLQAMTDAIAAAAPGRPVDIRLVRLHLSPG